MQVVYERCCGIDVHKQTVVACAIVPGADGQASKETRTFGTMTENWRRWRLVGELGVTHVAMESTGVYWKPVFNLLDGRFAILVVNAEHVKALAGRKTDVQDAEWMADLLRHGLLKGSFIPSEVLRELRDLTRYRTKLGDERKSEVNRVQKVLEDANIKLASVAIDVMGVSGRAMLAELVKGETDPALLAELAKGRLRDKQELLQKALSGRVRPHHRFMLAQHLSHIDFLDEAIAQLDQQIEEQMRPFAAALATWDSLPGINQRLAEIIVAEIGPDLSPLRMPSTSPPGPACVRQQRECRQTQERQNPQRQSLAAPRTDRSGPWRSHTKHKYFQALYRRLAARRGKQGPWSPSATAYW